MAGLIFGHKYTATNNRKIQCNRVKKEGIFLGRNNKYQVQVKNEKGKNKWLNPYILIGQFDDIEKAESCYRDYIKSMEEKQ